MDNWSIAMLGEGSVGKSALVQQLVMESFVGASASHTYDPTIEESYRKQFPIDDQLCMLEIIDTAGQEDYATLRNLWVTNCQGFILVYSITQRSSFERVHRYYNDMIRTKRGTAKFILVGNKYDKQNQREVSTEEGYKLAVDWGCKFFETSAKTRHNVEEAFTSIIRTLRASGRQGDDVAPRPPAPQRQKWYQKCVVL